MTKRLKSHLKNEEKTKLGGFSPVLSHLLFHRDIKDTHTGERFINPDYERDMHDPFLMKDIEKSAQRIIKAIKDNEKIAIYADYDADGIPGSAMFRDFLDRIGFDNFSIYIPHRHNEGFGLNKKAIEKIKEEGTKLIITIDCGIADVEQVRYASELGIEVIITDHHEASDILPPAYAIVDHKQKDCKYPDKNLCGTGVAFKLIQAILKIDRMRLKEGQEKWFLDLVGIATLSDMVSLTGENRVFAKYGLEVLKKTQRKGLKQLFNHLRMNQSHIVEDDIAFMITPRINAASRMDAPMDAYVLLSAKTDDEAYKAVLHLDRINNERKGVVASLVKEVKKKVREKYKDQIPPNIVMGNPDWKPSLLGLVANSCAEEFDRPVFLWGRDGMGIIKGSCRSEGKSHVVEIMKSLPQGILVQFGGHHHSGGFVVSEDAVYKLEEYFNGAEKKGDNESTKSKSTKDKKKNTNKSESELKTLDEGDIAPEIEQDIDMALSLEEINYDLWNDINKLAPFGMGNHKPLFLIKDIVPSDMRIFGKENAHVEIVFTKKDGTKIKAIKFFGAGEDWAKKLKENKDRKIDLIASLEKSVFRNEVELRLRISEVGFN
jgi:single-stranded-DNA-specific exonuclease